MNYLLSILAAALYSVASARLYLALDRGRAVSLSDLDDGVAHDQWHRRRRITLGFALVAMAVHGWIAFAQTHLPGDFVMPFFTALALTAVFVVALHLLLCLRQPADYLGLAIYPLAAVSLLSSQSGATPVSNVLDASVKLHVLLSVLANAVLALAAAQAILVSVQRRFLNTHRPGGFMRALPPLETTETLLFMLIGTGFALLTLSLATGFLYLDDMFAQNLVHKTVLGSLAWAIFGALLLGRWRFGWRGRRAVHLTLGGFAVLLLAYFGSKLVLELILHRL